MKKYILLLFLLFINFNYALANIYCPQNIYCVKGVCKPNENDNDFHQDKSDSIPTNGKYKFIGAYFSLKITNYVECYYRQNEEHSVMFDASQPLYPDFTNSNNAWTATNNDYNGPYTCSGDSQNCPLQLSPELFYKYIMKNE